MVEMGRFCIAPGLTDADILRVAWAAMTRYVDENAVEMLFGCSSFQGTEADGYEDAFAFSQRPPPCPKPLASARQSAFRVSVLRSAWIAQT